VLLPAAADDTVFQARLGAFLQGLALLGWTIGRNVRIDTHWATANAADIWTLGLQLVWDVVSQSGVGERRQAYVIDTQGRLIAHTDTSLVLSNADMTQLAQVRAARTDGAGAGGEAKDINGRDVLTAYAPVAPPGWLVFVEMPIEEAK
jgi:hypothetical protein